MGRLVRNWEPDRVKDAVVAPHRYLWNDEHLPDLTLDCNSYAEIMAAIPYKAGEVIYVQQGSGAAKARIIDVGYYRSDFTGDRIAWYKVQMETADGYWSKQWIKVFPGFVQRGYRNAGLAPDVPD